MKFNEFLNSQKGHKIEYIAFCLSYSYTTQNENFNFVRIKILKIPITIDFWELSHPHVKLKVGFKVNISLFKTFLKFSFKFI